MKYTKFDIGQHFIVETKTDYEKLPIDEGEYMVVHDSYFDGEKYWTGEYSSVVKVVKKDAYTIESKVLEFNKDTLRKLYEEGYLRYYEED